MTWSQDLNLGIRATENSSNQADTTPLPGLPARHGTAQENCLLYMVACTLERTLRRNQRSKEGNCKALWPVSALVFREGHERRGCVWFVRGLLLRMALQTVSLNQFLFCLMLKGKERKEEEWRVTTQTLIIPRSQTSELQFPQQDRLSFHIQCLCYHPHPLRHSH